ncbi:MAG: cytochrome c [Blastochloris sp.]|nr:cytochrome c [Blastochloris sp.]
MAECSSEPAFTQALADHKLLSSLILALSAWVFIGCSPTPPSAPAPVVDIDTLLREGEQLYSQSCAQCHYAGEGSTMIPSLRGSGIVSAAPEKLIHVILRGQNGVSVINGKKVNGVMPGQPYLSDLEVAAISTYVRTQFGGESTPVQPSQVQALR